MKQHRFNKLFHILTTNKKYLFEIFMQIWIVFKFEKFIKIKERQYRTNYVEILCLNLFYESCKILNFPFV